VRILFVGGTGLTGSAIRARLGLVHRGLASFTEVPPHAACRSIERPILAFYAAHAAALYNA
jgi:hypothetical protein